jgi:fructose-1,6-bisphosphatase/inositol monophosphatase family enzyme
MQDLENMFEKLCVAVRHAGVVAKSLQGKVQNEGKANEIMSQDESERLKAQRTAKTVIDETVQDILLTSLYEDADAIMLDAEEHTPLSEKFAEKGEDISIVIDPIDGTLEYLEGKDSYSICIGMIERGVLKMAIVFFPMRDAAYAIAPDGISYAYDLFMTEGTKNARRIVLPAQAQRVVYKNSRLPGKIITALNDAGFITPDDSEGGLIPPDAMLEMLTGESCACICETRSIRDIFVGAILGNAEGGFTMDGAGNPLVWPSKGKVPRVIFGNTNVQKEIVQALRDASK